MKPKWLRVRKTYQGGTSDFDYIMLHPDDNAEEAARSWARKSPGGHNIGWTVHWTPVDMPPIKWIDKKIEGLERQLKAVESNIEIHKKEEEIILKKMELNEKKLNLAITDKNKLIKDWRF